MQKVISSRALVLNSKDELLLVTHNEISYWYTPGGKWEDNETLIECAERETFEETGLKVKLEKLVYVDERINDNKDGEKRHYLASFFFGKTDLELPEKWYDSGGSLETIAKFISQKDIEKLDQQFPTFIKDKFWIDYKNNFPNSVYINNELDFNSLRKPNTKDSDL